MHGAVADGMNGSCHAGLAGTTDQGLHFLALDDGDAQVARLAFIGSEHQRSARTERAVGENLLRAEAQPVIAKAAAQTAVQRGLNPFVVNLLGHAQRQFATLAQDLQSLKTLRAVKIVQASQSGGERLLLGRGHQCGQLSWRRLRQVGAHKIHCRLQQNACRLALGIALNSSAWRIGRTGVQPTATKRCAVHPGGMAAFCAQVDRIRRRNCVQIRRRREKWLRPVIPVTSPDR